MFILQNITESVLYKMTIGKALHSLGPLVHV